MKAKLILAGMLVGVLAFGAASASSHAGTAANKPYAGKTLTVSTWGGTWTDAFKKYFAVPFSKATGAKFKYITSGTDPDAPVLLQKQAGNVSVDLVDSGLGSELLAHQALAKFPDSLLKVLKKNSVPGTVSPYWWTYGTTIKMLVCNTAAVSKCPANLRQFWDVDKYPGRRMMIADPKESVVAALLAAGVSRATIVKNPPLAKAKSMLAKIKPHVDVWAQSGDQQLQSMANGDATIALMWETRAVPLIAQGKKLKLSWVGANSQSDFGFLVPEGAPNADVAFAFLQWIAEHPKNQAGMASAIGTFLPGKDVVKYTPKSKRQFLPQSHAKNVFYWDSTWYSTHARDLQTMWKDVIG